jgi:hypothetical protein
MRKARGRHASGHAIEQRSIEPLDGSEENSHDVRDSFEDGAKNSPSDLAERFPDDMPEKFDSQACNGVHKHKQPAKEASSQVFHPTNPDRGRSAQGGILSGVRRLSSVGENYSASANGLNLVSRS